MPRRRVFSIREKSAFSECAGRFRNRGQSGKRAYVTQAHSLQIWKRYLSAEKNIAERVGSGISPFGRIGHLPDPRGIKHQ
jgi:hypothetical protein